MINNVVLVGRLTRDPDLRYTSSGVAVATFSLAVNRNFTSQNGERETDFINCVIWRKPAETLANYARKGTLIGLTGRIQTRNYESQQGQRVYVTEVVADNFQLLESKAVNDQRRQAAGNFDNNVSQPFNNNNNSFDQPASSQPFSGMPGFDRDASNTPLGGSSIDISDDDLPF